MKYDVILHLLAGIIGDSRPLFCDEQCFGSNTSCKEPVASFCGASELRFFFCLFSYTFLDFTSLHRCSFCIRYDAIN